MVKRFTAGVVSATAPTLSGIFNTVSAMQNQQANLWPVPGFNASYNTLITSFSGVKYYVDAIAGNDSYSGTTRSAAFATIGAAHSARAANTAVNVMIIILPGTYSVSPHAALTNGASALYDLSGSGTIYVCAPGKVTINYTAGATRDAPFFHFQNAASAVYGATILRDNSGKTVNYSVAIFDGTTASFKGTINNCVLGEINANNKWSVQYDNSGAIAGTVDHCSFYVQAAGTGDYTGTTGLSISNSLFNYTYTTTSASLTNNTVLTAHDMTSTNNYNVAGTTWGVYYGTYAWPT